MGSWHVLAVAALAGCAAAEARTVAVPVAAPSPTSTLGLTPGENMAFEVHLGGVLAGDAALAVGEIGQVDGHRAVVVTSRAQTTGAVALFKQIVDQATTTIDVDTGNPMRIDTLVEMGDKSYTAVSTFTGGRADVAVTKRGETRPQQVHFDFRGKPAYDTHAAMAQLRGWRAPPGTRRTVWVVGGRRLWRVDLTFVGDETIGSALGNRHAVHLAGASYRARGDLGVETTAPARTFDVWLSDDADRVPLKVVAKTELGDVVMDLTEYNR
jgi:hypothetical protein